MRPALLVLLLGTALAGGGENGWRALELDGRLVPAAPLRAALACPRLRLPASWDVRSAVYTDLTGDGRPECVLAVWRPWRDWPIARWSAAPTPIMGNRDARGDSAHIAVLKPRPDGTFRQVWVGSALSRPVTALTVLPSGHLVTLEGTYARGRDAAASTLSEWTWTDFGFRLERRISLTARQLLTDDAGRPAFR